MADDEILCRKLVESDVHPTADVLARAFADNPAYTWMHPRAATRARDLRAFFERNLRWHIPLDLTWVATSGPRIVGTSTLEPPGGVRSGLYEAIAHWLLPTVRHQGLSTFLRMGAADREFRERYRALTRGTSYYHVHAVAVAPEFQGRGVGSMLVATTLRECERLSARDSAPAVVSTQRERNLPLYERAGFTLREDHQMGLRWGSRGYRTWFMVRAAPS
jgi:GNAT superfamily N-acetyltransferase